VGALQVALRGLCAAAAARGPGGAARVCLLLDGASEVDDPRGTDWLMVRHTARLNLFCDAHAAPGVLRIYLRRF
jgi:hypothetical protein